MPRRPASAYLFAAVPVLFWGTSFATVKLCLDEISPAGLVAVRAVLALAALLPAAFLFRDAGGVAAARGEAASSGDAAARGDAVSRGGVVVRGDARRGDRRRCAFLGVVGVPLQLGLQTYALRLTTANHCGWIVALSPVATACLAALLLRERFPWPKTLGVALGFAGATAVMLGGGRASLALPATRGDLLVLVSAFNWSVYTLVARRLMAGRASLPLTLRIFAWGAAGAVAFYLAVGDPRELLAVPPRVWALLAYLGIGCSGIAYLCWSLALERLEAARLASFQNVQPLVTLASAALVLGESPGAAALLGGLFVIVGVTLVQRAKPAPRSAEA